jgi:magnesium transporter
VRLKLERWGRYHLPYGIAIPYFNRFLSGRLEFFFRASLETPRRKEDTHMFEHENERTGIVRRIEGLVVQKRYSDLRGLLLPMEAADIALLMEDLSEESMPLVFRLLPKELAAEVFVELDSDQQELLIRGFSNTELREVLDELYLDDMVDIVEEMPANVVKRILMHSAPDMRKGINEILKYPEDSAGSIMTTEFVDLKQDMTVSDAFKRIRRTGPDKETINICYVIDENRHLIGLVSIRTLLLADEEAVIRDIMEKNIISVSTLDDQEYVARSLSKYDFLALPVVDTENRLVGIVTVDDAMDVLQDEVTEDIEKMAAIVPTDKPYMKTGVFEIFRARIPWLLLLMISATFTGQIISKFETALSAFTVLTAYIPMLMDTGGNSGSQSSVTVIRSISLNEIEFSDIFRVIWKEIRVAVVCGIVLAGANFVKLILVDRLMFHNPEVTVLVSAVVCCTLVVTVFCSKLVGCTLPLLAKKIGFDPAVMASPFITTIVDAISLLIYFRFASIILGI